MKKGMTALATVLSFLAGTVCTSAAAQTLSSVQKKGLIILVEFTGRTAAGIPAKTFSMDNAQELYRRVANEKGFTHELGFTQSVYDYFYAQSEGQLEFTFDVVGPYRLSNVYSYYGGDTSTLQDAHLGQFVYDACRKANADVNFADYDFDGDGKVDQLFILYAGQGQNTNGTDTGLIWPQEGSLKAVGSDQAPFEMDGVIIETFACSSELGEGAKIDGIGTICHEFAHTLGLPDTYDKGTGFGQTSLVYGTYVWDPMNMGNYLNGGFTPAGFTAYERMACGWKQPIELKADTVVNAMKPLSEGGDTYIIYNDGDRNEYFLLENRQQTGCDAALYGTGLMITHVDYDSTAFAGNNVNTTKERMSLVAADNSKERTTTDVAGDLYPTSSNNAFGNTTMPQATLIHANSDGSFLLNKSITDITQNADGTIAFRFTNDNATAIKSVITDETAKNRAIYTLNGQYMGTETSTLSKGIYVVGGRKVVVK